jgi:hypothetical protein
MEDRLHRCYLPSLMRIFKRLNGKKLLRNAIIDMIYIDHIYGRDCYFMDDAERMHIARIRLLISMATAEKLL